MGDRLTHRSAWGLIRDVVAFAKRLADQGGHPQPVREAVASLSMAGLSSVVWRAPGLMCEIRPSDLPPPSLVLLTFRQEPPDSDIATELRALTRGLPALEPPLRESYDDAVTWQEAYKAHIGALFTWIFAHPDDPAGDYRRACERRAQFQAMLAEQRHACRTLTIHVGLNGRLERWPARYRKARRQVETWRFKPERRSPLEEALANRKPIDRLTQQGKIEEAAALAASKQRLIARMDAKPESVKRQLRERLPRGWRSLWIDAQQPLDDIAFQLVLYLRQERLLDLTPDVSGFLKHYTRQFKYALTEEERELLPERFQLDQGGSGFGSLLWTYAEPEDWRALRRYIAKTLHGRQASEARKAAKELPASSEGRQSYNVDEVIRILESEADVDASVPDRATMYRWINAEKIPVTLDARGRKWFNDASVQRVRALVKEQHAWKALKQYLIEVGTQKGNKNPEAAAEKQLQRYRKSGTRVEDLVRKILEDAGEVRSEGSP
jgi:hypothetical protein